MEKQRSAKINRKPTGGYVRPGILGRTPDGVYIIKPRQPATHFTDSEVGEAVRAARSGQFLPVKAERGEPSNKE